VGVYKANDQAMDRYAPRPYAGRITLLRVGGGAPERALDRAMGWSAFTPFPVDVREISGTHQTMMRDPHVQALAGELLQCLRAVDPPSE
jgi:thioesterase domain-containing protein